MPCIPRPPVEFPTLPSGLSVTPPAPSPPSFDADLCCKIVSFTPPLPALPFPPGLLNAGVIQALQGYADAALAYLDALPIRCPKET